MTDVTDLPFEQQHFILEVVTFATIAAKAVSQTTQTSPEVVHEGIAREAKALVSSLSQEQVKQKVKNFIDANAERLDNKNQQSIGEVTE